MDVFATIFGKSKSSELSSSIDDLISTLPVSKQTDIGSYDSYASKAIKEVIQYTQDKNNEEPEISQVEKLFDGVSIPKERLNRYNVYDELFKTVSLIKRIFSVYTSNVFQKDTISNKILYVRDHPNQESEEQSEISRKIVKVIIDYFNLEEKLKHFIGHNTFKYGDAFLEILDLDSQVVQFPSITTIPESQKKSSDSINKYVSEDVELEILYNSLKSKNQYKKESFETNFDSFASLFIQFTDEIEYYDDELTNPKDIILESSDSDTGGDFNFNKLKRIAIRLHKPHNILPLLTPYGNIIGYIELKTVEKSTNVNSLNRFLEIAEKISSLHSSGNTKELNNDLIYKFVDHAIKKILQKNKIIKNPKQSAKEYEQVLKDTLKEDLYYSIKNVYISTQKDSLYRKKLNIRFIPVENLFWFKLPSSEYYPFGQSLIDPLVIPGKLLTFNQLANAIIKLSRASLIRKWTVELGSREDSSALLQKLKKSFKNQRVTANDLGSSKDIANILSDFRDLVVFTKRGQAFVDVELKELGNPQIKIQDIEDQRRELIALSGVPPTYVGYPDAVDMREQLIHANVSLATEVSNIQHNFNYNTNLIISRICEITSLPQVSKYVEASLFPPTVLQLQMVELSITSVTNLINILSEMKSVHINPIPLLKKYIPFMEWDEVIKTSEILNQKEKTKYANQALAAMNGGTMPTPNI